jgi:hypothetical protein
MSEIEELRMKIKKSFSNLVEEYPNIVEFNPLGEIIDFLNEGYISNNKQNMVKEQRVDFVLTESDKIEIPKIIGSKLFEKSSLFNHDFSIPNRPISLFQLPVIDNSEDSEDSDKKDDSDNSDDEDMDIF